MIEQPGLIGKPYRSRPRSGLWPRRVIPVKLRLILAPKHRQRGFPSWRLLFRISYCFAFQRYLAKAYARSTLGCRPNLPEGFHSSDSLPRFAPVIPSFHRKSVSFSVDRPLSLPDLHAPLVPPLDSPMTNPPEPKLRGPYKGRLSNYFAAAAAFCRATSWLSMPTVQPAFRSTSSAAPATTSSTVLPTHHASSAAICSNHSLPIEDALRMP